MTSPILKTASITALGLLALAALNCQEHTTQPMDPPREIAPTIPDPIDPDSDLHAAAEAGDLGQVVKLISADFEAVLQQDDYQRTPLHLAARYGHTSVVVRLIEAGANIDAVAYNKFTPLHLAVSFDRTETVSVLLESGASTDPITSFSMTALQLAADKNNKAIVEILRKSGARTDLKSAIFLGERDTVLRLMTAEPDLITRPDAFPLSWAARKGQSQILKDLIDAGAEVHKLDHMIGSYPLWWAAVEKHLDCVKILIEAGAKIDQPVFYKPYGDLTPLHLAVVQKNKPLAILLLNQGADPNAAPELVPGGDKRSALQLAVVLGHDEMAALLKSHK